MHKHIKQANRRLGKGPLYLPENLKSENNYLLSNPSSLHIGQSTSYLRVLDMCQQSSRILHILYYITILRWRNLIKGFGTLSHTIHLSFM